MKALGDFVLGLKHRPTIDVLPYHRAGIDKYERLGHEYRMRGIEPPTHESTQLAVQTLRDKGLKVTVKGEANDNE